MSARHTSLEDKQRRMRERHGRGASVPDPEFVSLDFKERHYTPTELATLWKHAPLDDPAGVWEHARGAENRGNEEAPQAIQALSDDPNTRIDR